MTTQLIQIIEFVLGGIVSLGVLAGGIGYLVSQFSKGKGDEKKDDLETQNELTLYLKNQVEGYKEIADKQNKKIADMDKELTTFKALIEEKDKTIAKYLEILQNRNPDLEKSLKEISASMSDIKVFMQHVDTHLEKSSKDMKITGTVTQQ